MKLLQKFDKIISLGSNCFIKMFVEHIGIHEETNYFDYLGSSMWAVNELFMKNTFSEIFDNKDDFVNMQIFDCGDKFLVTNQKYYLRFKHDFKQKYEIYRPNPLTNFPKIKLSYQRRHQRMMEYLRSTTKKFLFMRFAEDYKHRTTIMKDENELSLLIKLSNYFQETYKSLSFTIMFLSPSHDTQFLRDERIVIIQIFVGIYQNTKHP